MTRLANYIRWQDTSITIPTERIQKCEEWGYDAVFMGEGLGIDAFTILGYVAAITKKSMLATCIAQIPGRMPTMLANSAQTLQQVAGPDREIVLGIGTSVDWAAEGFYGVSSRKPVARLRDYAGAIRKAFTGDPIEYDGKTLSIPYKGEDAKGCPPVAPGITPNPNIPIYAAAGGPLAIKTVAEIFDGWYPKAGTYNPYKKHVYDDWLNEGFAKAKGPRSIDDLDIWVHLDVVVDDDVKRAMADIKDYIVALWYGFGSHMAMHGYEAEVAEINDRVEAGDPKAAAAAVPEQYIDDGWLLGPMDRIRERIHPWLDCGMGGLIIRSGSQKPNCTEPENIDVYKVIADEAKKYR